MIHIYAALGRTSVKFFLFPLWASRPHFPGLPSPAFLAITCDTSTRRVFELGSSSQGRQDSPRVELTSVLELDLGFNPASTHLLAPK